MISEESSFTLATNNNMVILGHTSIHVPAQPHVGTHAVIKVPTKVPLKVPTKVPLKVPIKVPTKVPLKVPTKVPTKVPLKVPFKTLKVPTCGGGPAGLHVGNGTVSYNGTTTSVSVGGIGGQTAAHPLKGISVGGKVCF